MHILRSVACHVRSMCSTKQGSVSDTCIFFSDSATASCDHTAHILQAARMEFGLLPGIAPNVPSIEQYIYIHLLIQMSDSRKTHIQSTCTNITVMHIQRLAHTCSHQCLLIQMCTPVSVGSTLAIACLLVPADFHSLLQQCTIDLYSTTRLSSGRQEM
jgi:hypothetical protein